MCDNKYQIKSNTGSVTRKTKPRDCVVIKL